MVAVLTNPYKKKDWREYGKGFVGQRLEKEGNEHTRNEFGEADYVHELRCRFCGRTYHFYLKDKMDCIAKGIWEFDHNRKAHCGNSSCADFYKQHIDFKRERYAFALGRNYNEKLFFNMKKLGQAA
jgi:hypothetical protein